MHRAPPAYWKIALLKTLGPAALVLAASAAAVIFALILSLASRHGALLDCLGLLWTIDTGIGQPSDL